MNIEFLQIPNGPKLSFVGPPLSDGKAPTLFYFSISGEESLSLDPFNQPVKYLENSEIRIFSIDLPFHGEGLPKEMAMDKWAKSFKEGDNIIENFVESVKNSLDYLIQLDLVDEKNLAAAGLSRGAFVATHLAAKDERFRLVLGFAPLTYLSHSQTFNKISSAPLIHALSLENLVDNLTHVTLRYYIGNRDILVDTASCFAFTQKLVEAKHKIGERSPKVELIISPSVGHKGHGTLPHLFRDGAHWLQKELIG